MQHHPAGCSPISHGLGGFWGDLPLPLGLPVGRVVSGGMDPQCCLFGGFGGCGCPFPGIFVPQPLEATEAL